jgi:hypothetical protein
MKPNAARLTGANEIGLPDTDTDHTNGDYPPLAEKKTAAPAGPRNGGNEGLPEAIAKPLREECRKAVRLTSVGLVACFNDEGHLFGWEVAR